jgi:hypothetical protein
MARKCFYSFHFEPDNWRAGTVRSIGAIEGNSPASDNDWESITSGPNNDQKIKNWIDNQMSGKTCAVVLVGTGTAKRKWINYEIIRAWNDGLGVVGIHIHGLKDRTGTTSNEGLNPFAHITHETTGKPLSQIAKCYNPPGQNSKERYDWIARYLADAVEEAINIRDSKGF